MPYIYHVNLELVLAGILVACSAAFADAVGIQGVGSYVWGQECTPSTIASILGYWE